MFDPSSRYANVPDATLTVTDPEGGLSHITYKRRRFLPPAEALTLLLDHTVTRGERLDHIAARYLADPRLFWRLCDANDILRPEELTDGVGRVIHIAMAGP